MSSISLLGTAFTPLKIDSIDPIVGDRPFAFLLALSFNQVNSIGTNKKNFEALSINVGLYGTDVGYKFQSFAHKYIVKGRPEDPFGWNTQISQPGKFTMLVNYERMKLFSITKKNATRFNIDGFGNLGGSLGYYDRLYTNVYMRIGWFDRLNLPSWAYFGHSLGTASRNSTAVPVTPQQNLKCQRWEFFGFGKVGYNYFFRNSSLVGQKYVHDDIYVLDKDWVNDNVIDFDFGAALGFKWIKNPEGDANERWVRLVYKNTIRSPEFDSGIFPERWHYFGSVGIQYQFN